MALGNFIASGSYTVAVLTMFDKHQKTVGFISRTYSDNNKSVVLCEMNFHLNGSKPSFVIAQRGLNTPPASPVDGDSYLIGDTPTGDWAGRAGRLVSWLVDHWENRNLTTVYCTADSKFYTQGNSDVFVEAQGFDTSKFDASFSMAQIGGANNDILKAVYTYMKTLTQFANCTDV